MNDVTNESIGQQSISKSTIDGLVELIKADDGEQLLRWLDLHSIKINLPLPYHYSNALQLAVANNAHQTVELLLQIGANANAVDREGANALHLAVQQNNPYLVRLLLKSKANINVKNASGKTALSLARTNKSLTNLLRFDAKSIAKIDRCNKHGETHLHKFAEAGDHVAVVSEINLGANVNAQCNAGHTPLHKAALEGHADVAEALIKAGASLNLQNQDGDTPLHDASSNHHLDVISLLLDSGADPRISNLVGDLPRDRALEADGEDGPEIVSIFDVATQKLQSERQPIHNQHVPSTLLNRSRQVSADNRADSPSMGKSPVGSSSRVDRRNPTPSSHLYDDPKYKYKNGSGKMMVHTSIELGNVDALASLLEQGADRTVKDRAKRTPLHYAARSGNVEIARMLIEFYPSSSKSLSVDETEATVHMQVIAANAQLETPLHEAVGRFHPDMVEYLIEVGADPNASDSEGFTPLQRAIARGLGPNDPDVLVLQQLSKSVRPITNSALGMVTPESEMDSVAETKTVTIPQTNDSSTPPVSDHADGMNGVDQSVKAEESAEEVVKLGETIAKIAKSEKRTSILPPSPKPSTTSPASKRRPLPSNGVIRPKPVSPRLSRTSRKAAVKAYRALSVEPVSERTTTGSSQASSQPSPAVSPTTVIPEQSIFQPPKVVKPATTNTPRKPILRIPNLKAQYQPSVTSSRYKSPLPLAGIHHESILEYFPTPDKLQEEHTVNFGNSSPPPATTQDDDDGTMEISNLLN